jgi:hypothetical protein
MPTIDSVTKLFRTQNGVFAAIIVKLLDEQSIAYFIFVEFGLRVSVPVGGTLCYERCFIAFSLSFFGGLKQGDAATGKWYWAATRSVAAATRLDHTH